MVFTSCEKKEEIERSMSLTLSSDSEGGTIDVIITSDKDIIVSSDYPDWIKESQAENFGEKKFHLTVSKNHSGIAREHSVIFIAESVMQFSYSVLMFNNLGDKISIEGVSAGDIKVDEKSLSSKVSLILKVKQSAQKEDNTFDYTLYFADKVCSELKQGITLNEINNISDVFFKNLALEIYNKKYDKEFRVQEYKQYQHPKVMADLNKTSPYSLLDNPTGIYVKKGEVFIVIADLKGEISLRSIDLSVGYDSGVESFVLNDGINQITATKGGLLYVLYHTDSKTGTQDNIKLNITGGVINGYFDSQKHTQEDWLRLLNQATYQDFDVLGKYAHLTFPTASFKANTPNGIALIDKYDELVYLEQEFMGLVKYNKMFQNRMYFHVDYVSSYYMYATSNRTGYTLSTMNDIMTSLQSFQVNMWGPAHEVGHCNQTRPGMRWLGMVEVTNNIHSLHVQTSFGNTSRLIASNFYNYAFANYVNKNIALNLMNDSPESGVFYKLIPFWQLKLYLMDAIGKKDFYKDLYELYRTTNFIPSGTSTSDGFYQLKFVENVCQVSNLDMTDFFQAWGFLTAVDTIGISNTNTRFTVTQADINAVKNKITSKGYDKPAHSNIYNITDNNVSISK